MKASEFTYLCPSSLDDALAQLSRQDEDSQPLAGGQSLMPMMNLRLAAPKVLVDLNKLPELDFIHEQGETIHIGSMVRYSTLMESSVVRRCIPLFTKALPYIAHQAVRNRGTIGGSVALADPAAEMPALLMALDANVVVVSQSGQREIPAADFFLGMYETALEHGELVHSIQVPVATANQRFGFHELTRRHGDYAMAGVAIRAGSVEPFSDLRIVFFSVADHALRAPAAEDRLSGHRYGNAVIDDAKQTLSTLELNADLNASEAVKRHLCGVVMQRALADMSVEKP